MKNIALRERDIEKLLSVWGEGKAYSPRVLEGCIGRACMNLLGVNIRWEKASGPAKPGRPAGIRGHRKGAGRRATTGWKQLPITEEAAECLRMTAEVLREGSKTGRVLSYAMTLFLVARYAPRPLSAWYGPIPKWAVTPSLLTNSEVLC